MFKGSSWLNNAIHQLCLQFCTLRRRIELDAVRVSRIVLSTELDRFVSASLVLVATVLCLLGQAWHCLEQRLRYSTHPTPMQPKFSVLFPSESSYFGTSFGSHIRGLTIIMESIKKAVLPTALPPCSDSTSISCPRVSQPLNHPVKRCQAIHPTRVSEPNPEEKATEAPLSCRACSSP